MIHYAAFDTLSGLMDLCTLGASQYVGGPNVVSGMLESWVGSIASTAPSRACYVLKTMSDVTYSAGIGRKPSSHFFNNMNHYSSCL